MIAVVASLPTMQHRAAGGVSAGMPALSGSWLRRWAVSLRPITLELLGRSCELADELGTCVEAVLIGDDVEGHADALTAYGADTIWVAQDTRLAAYEVSQYTGVLADAIREREPYAVLLGSTVMGRELAARLAGRLSLGLTGGLHRTRSG